jgi:hypothetical protein
MEHKPQQELTLADLMRKMILIFRFLLSKWVTISTVCIGFGVLGIVYAWQQKPTYIAEMTFTTEAEGATKLGGYLGLAAQFGIDLGGGSNNMFEGDNLAQLLTSRNLVETTLLSPSGNGNNLMIDEYVDFNEMRKAWQNEDLLKGIKFNVDRSQNTRIHDSIIGAVSSSIIKSDLQVYRKDKKLTAITAEMKSSDEVFSKKFIELLASNAIRFYTAYKSKRAVQNVQVLQKQTDSVRALLFGGIADVATINDLNVNPVKQSLRIPSQHKQIDVQVNGALYTELLKNLELAKLSLRKETPLIQIIDTPVLPLEKKKMGRLKTGVLFAFAGGLLTALILLASAYLKAQFNGK